MTDAEIAAVLKQLVEDPTITHLKPQVEAIYNHLAEEQENDASKINEKLLTILRTVIKDSAICNAEIPAHATATQVNIHTIGKLTEAMNTLHAIIAEPKAHTAPKTAQELIASIRKTHVYTPAKP